MNGIWDLLKIEIRGLKAYNNWLKFESKFIVSKLLFKFKREWSCL